MSKRSRSQYNINTQISGLESTVKNLERDRRTLESDAVASENIQDSAVQTEHLQDRSVTSEKIARGAVGTENLGIVNSITSDSSLHLSAPEGIKANEKELVVIDSLPTDDGYILIWNDATQKWVPSEPPPPPPALPTGVMNIWPTNTAPSGWLLCQGQAVSRTTYAALFAVLGTTYGSGNGSTTFNLPDMRDRVPVGRRSGDADFGNLNQKAGSKTHTLSVSEMPSHRHNYTGGAVGVNSASDATTAQRGYAQSTGRTLYVNYEGGGEAHNNLQPYIVLNYIIKAD